MISSLFSYFFFTAYLKLKPPVIFSGVSNNSNIIKIKARKVVNNEEIEFERTINLSDTVAYIDMWRSHWCTYYNDREFFFTPRINEMLQRLRRYKIPVVTISQFADILYPLSNPRRLGRKYIKEGTVREIANYYPQQTTRHKEYIPKFKDICVYKDLVRFGETRDNRLNPKISFTDEDVLTATFQESAESFVGIGKKTVIFFGQHTNMCLMAVFMYCKRVGIDLIIVRDLVDACWVYELEKSYASSHSKGNNITNSFFEKEYGTSILSYDLIRALNRLDHYDQQKVNPTYSFFTKTAYMFQNI